MKLIPWAWRGGFPWVDSRGVAGGEAGGGVWWGISGHDGLVGGVFPVVKPVGKLGWRKST